MRVTIVGAGIIGLSCAYFLQRAGAEVTLIDAAAPGAGASRGNAGWVTPSLSAPVPAPGVPRQALRWVGRADSPIYVRPRLDPAFLSWMLRFWRNTRGAQYRSGLAATAELGREAFAAYDQLRAAGLEFEEHRDGLLFAYLTEQDLERHTQELQLLAPYGYRAQVTTAAGVAALEPALGPAVHAAALVEQERHVRPESLTAALTERLVYEGAKLLVDTSVTDVRLEHGRVQGVTTSNGAIDGDAVLLCTGAHASLLARRLGLRIPMQAGKGYSVDHTPPPVTLRRPIYLHEARVAVTPFDGMLRVAGAMELSGQDARPCSTRTGAILQATSRYLPGVPASPAHIAWTGMRPMTPDGLPVIGPIPGARGAFIASGHAMLGVTLGPVTGRHVTSMVLNGRPDEVLLPFSAERRW